MRNVTKSVLCSSVTAALLACAFSSTVVAAEKVRTNQAPSSVIRGAAPDGTITAANVGGASIAGNSDGGGLNVAIACTEFGTVGGPERIYQFTPGSGAALTFTVAGAAGSFDPAIYVLSTLGDGDSCLSGSDDVPSVYAPAVTVSGLTPGVTYYLYVDSYWGGAEPDPVLESGPFSISVTGTFPVSLQEYKVD